MVDYLIPWCDGMFTLKRIVLYEGLRDEHQIGYVMLIEEQATRLGIPIISAKHDSLPAEGDLWIGVTPHEGWGKVADECAWARSAELPLIPLKLMKARLNLEYIKEFHPANNDVQLGVHIIGAKLSTHFGSRHNLVQSLVAVARDTYPDLPDAAFATNRVRTRKLFGSFCICFYVDGVTNEAPSGYSMTSHSMIG